MFRNKLLRQPGSLSSLAAGGPSFYCDLSLRQMKGRANNAIKCSGTYRFYFCGGKKKAWPTSFCLLQTFGQQSSLFSNRCAIRFCNLKKNPQRIFIYSLRLKPIRHFFTFLTFLPSLPLEKKIASEELWSYEMGRAIKTLTIHPQSWNNQHYGLKIGPSARAACTDRTEAWWWVQIKAPDSAKK